MSDYVASLLAELRSKDPAEVELHQAVEETAESIRVVFDRHPEYRSYKLLERMVEPERVILFRVPWMDDLGEIHVNRGIRVEMSSAIGPFKGGMRFHPSVNLGIVKFLAFQQVFKNALTTLPMGGAQGGSDFDPKGKSDTEVMRFCQSLMTELFRHLGHSIDVVTADVGVGAREIGFLFGQYKRLSGEFAGVFTGKGTTWGGSLVRPEATGYGVAYFAAEMLATRHETLADKTCLVSGCGNVALYTAEKLLDLGAKVVTMSDSNGHIYDPEGIDREKLQWLVRLRDAGRGRIQEYVEQFKSATYTEARRDGDHSPLWSRPAHCAFPSATQNEINANDAQRLVDNGVSLVCEGANMPTTTSARRLLLERGVLFGPSKAANAGGVAVSGLELAQNSVRLSWSREKVDARLRTIMKSIHATCAGTAERFGLPGDYLAGANIAAFVRVADAMIDQGVV